MRVLIHEWVTGGGLAGCDLPRGWMTEGKAMRQAIADDFHAVEGVEVVMTLDDRFDGERNPWKTVHVASGQELEILQTLANEVDSIVMIAPETGGILQSRAEMIETTLVFSMGSSPEAIGLTTDKLRLSRHLNDHKIATPPSRSFEVAEGLPLDVDYPAVVKPIDGAGSEFTFVLRDRSEFVPSSGLPETMLVQPFIDGIPMSASFLVDREGSALLLGVGRQLIATQGGRIHYSGGTMPEPDAFALGEPRKAVASIKGLRGFIGVDFVVDIRSKATNLIEINPRPTTSFVGLQYRFGLGAIAKAWLLGVTPVAEPGWKTWEPSNPIAGPFRFRTDGTIEAQA